MQIHSEQTKAALEKIGVDVEYFRWWDERQQGDIIHFRGETPTDLIRGAQQNGIPVLFHLPFTSQRNDSDLKLACQAVVKQVVSSVALGKRLAERLGWTSYRAGSLS
jgi:hypothetical protein